MKPVQEVLHNIYAQQCWLLLSARTALAGVIEAISRLVYYRVDVIFVVATMVCCLLGVCGVNFEERARETAVTISEYIF